MVNMIVRGKRVANLAEGYPHLLEIRLHDSEGSWPTDVNKQTRDTRANNPVIG